MRLPCQVTDRMWQQRTSFFFNIEHSRQLLLSHALSLMASFLDSFFLSFFTLAVRGFFGISVGLTTGSLLYT